MKQSNIVFVYSDNVSSSNVYVAYDDNLLVRIKPFSIELMPLKLILSSGKNVLLVKTKDELTYRQKVRFDYIINKIISQEVKPSFKERFNFFKYLLSKVFDKSMLLPLADKDVSIVDFLKQENIEKEVLRVKR